MKNLTLALFAVVGLALTACEQQTTPSAVTRVGAECVDGTISEATGGGACSSHGGVYCWKMSDNTCEQVAKVKPAEPPHRIGAQCNDGTISEATGKGACSSHGGVACWKYSDGDCRTD
jgi:hypothetical protein